MHKNIFYYIAESIVGAGFPRGSVQDIADESGVSVRTVWRALEGRSMHPNSAAKLKGWVERHGGGIRISSLIVPWEGDVKGVIAGTNEDEYRISKPA